MDNKRLKYIDNIRLLVIIFAVIMHVAVTYSGFGEWGYKEDGQIGAVQTVIFGFYQAFTQGFAMGVMFLIAGYFIPEAYDKKGFSKFIKDRLVRPGIPTLTFMLIIGPFTYFTIALTLLFAPVSLIPIVKFAIASLVGVPICFLFTNYIIQKVPILRKIYA